RSYAGIVADPSVVADHHPAVLDGDAAALAHALDRGLSPEHFALCVADVPTLLPQVRTLVQESGNMFRVVPRRARPSAELAPCRSAPGRSLVRGRGARSSSGQVRAIGRVVPEVFARAWPRCVALGGCLGYHQGDGIFRVKA